MESRIIGVDPGINGGICILKLAAKPIILGMFPFTRPVPLPPDVKNAHIFVEQVQSSPLMGVTSAFTFGHNFGLWLGAIERAQPQSLTLVTPGVWQKAINAGAKGDKKKLKEMAVRLSGGDKRITLKTADAFLIAEYGRRASFINFI